jgi:hypothetical protein
MFLGLERARFGTLGCVREWASKSWQLDLAKSQSNAAADQLRIPQTQHHVTSSV